MIALGKRELVAAGATVVLFHFLDRVAAGVMAASYGLLP